jgi:hypothetical protein
METYTWEVLPAKWKAPTVDEQLASEYAWTLNELAKRGLVTLRSSFNNKGRMKPH